MQQEINTTDSESRLTDPNKQHIFAAIKSYEIHQKMSHYKLEPSPSVKKMVWNTNLPNLFPKYIDKLSSRSWKNIKHIKCHKIYLRSVFMMQQ